MALDELYRDALIVVAIVLGSIMVVGTLLTFLCNKYYRPGRCIFMSERKDDYDHSIVEREGTSEGETAVDGTSNNGFQTSEGGVGKQDDGKGNLDQQTTRTRTEATDGKLGEKTAVLEEQVVVEIDAGKSNRD